MEQHAQQTRYVMILFIFIALIVYANAMQVS